MAANKADDIFKEFKEHSISEFFKKNRQMLGYSSMVRSLVTVVHEYVTNSLDACEEAGILPDLRVKIDKLGDTRYTVLVEDNGPGIPKGFIGKALATVLAGTKFHRNVQQRGQQGIGAAGCTLFAQITTGKPIHAVSHTSVDSGYSCDVSIDTMHNKPVVTNMVQEGGAPHTGLMVLGEFDGVKYDNSDHGVYEYLKRTALSNPHVQIHFIDPSGQESTFLRSVDTIPERPKAARLHPLGLTVNDILDLAHASGSNRLSSFLTDTFSRFSQGKVNELKDIVGIDFSMDPKKMTWDDASKLVEGFKKVKWIAPESAHIVPIGKRYIELTLKNIINPEFMNVVERKPSVFKGGFPFIVEAAIAYGGSSGRQTDSGYTGNIMRFANRVPLLFDTGSCGITEAVKQIQWKRYGIDMDNQPVSVLVNISSVYIPYSGVGKEAISPEEEIVDEIKLALMDAARNIQHYIHGKQQLNYDTNRYKTIMRYTNQLSQNLSELTGMQKSAIHEALKKLVIEHYPRVKEHISGDSGKDADEVEQDEVSTRNREDAEE